ncbi:MAG TPA: hypothetical protein VNO30_30025 [Kofleriaceae bacterium]|nr:hypothetical protein [Kofleriaceae bacterium]
MRSTTIFIPLLLSNSLTACTDEPEPQPEPVTIAIAADKAPALVAFRDGLDGDWQTATMKTPTSFEAVVHGPYVISVACENLTTGEFTTRQVARTPEDEHDVKLECEPAAPSTHAITGHMMQAGRVQLGGASKTSQTADWDFALDVPSGTYDLMASTADRIALRRAIAITGDLEITAPIDLAQEGKDLAAAAFTVTNAAANETLSAAVSLGKAGQKLAFDVYQGPIATAKIAPDSALVESDLQRAAVTATAGNERRTLSRSFRVGGTTAYTLPAPLTGMKWEQANGNLAVSWGAITEPASFTVDVSGASADGSKHQRHHLEISSRFAAETKITRATVDTSIAGYKPEWKIDLAREYTRTLTVERASNNELATNAVSEIANKQ